MTTETTRLLYKVQDKLKEVRRMIDSHLYGGEPLPEEDVTYCRKVYSAVCEALDLL